MPDLRSSIERICSEWNQARRSLFPGNPLASFIRNEFTESVRSAVEGLHPGFEIKGSPGQGNWANVPWLSIIDPVVARNTMEGFYVVYLFCGDGSGVYLSLNQGVMGPKTRLGSKVAMEQAREVKSAFRAQLPLEGWQEDIDLRSKTTLGVSYEEPNIGAKFYPVEAIPSQAILEVDLRSILEIATNAIPVWREIQKRFGEELHELKGEIEPTLLPKPFLILAGISGTGKTRWVRKMARRTGDGEGNLCLVPVRPDWHEPSELLGYTSRISGRAEYIKTEFLTFLVRAWENVWGIGESLSPTAELVQRLTPHWLALDEMNLAPVEQYLADYLSVLELREWKDGVYTCPPLLRFGGNGEVIRAAFATAPEGLWQAFMEADGIPLPPNLIVVGTVNMDETTHAFSRKVLDRAFTVEFDPDVVVTAYRAGSTLDPVLGIELAENITVSASSILSTTTSGQEVPEPYRTAVESLIGAWNRGMEQSPFRVAFRTLDEALLFAIGRGETKLPSSLDGILMMKLLPRLEGDSDKLGYDGTEPMFDGGFPTEARGTLIQAAWHVAHQAMGDGEAWESSRSRKKLLHMAKRLARTGYTSFWP